MANVEKRSIALSPELAIAVDKAVAEGDYGNVSEVVRDALRQWKERRELHGYTVEELQRLWHEGLESGPAEPLTQEAMTGIREAAMQRLAARTRGA